MSTELQKDKTALPRSVKSWLASDYLREQIRLVLPKHCTAERMVRVALTALMRTPKLAGCTPESVMKCMLDLSALGLEPDGRRAHLIPYGNTCTLIIDYKGLVELARKNGEVSYIRADVVCDKDVFTYVNGEVNHAIDFRNDRGPMYAAYAVVTFKDGSKHSEVMVRSEIEAIRKRSKAGDDGPWVTDYNEMAKKTCFRRASKWITLSPEVQDALDCDVDTSAVNGSLVEEMPTAKIEMRPADDDDLPMETKPETKGTVEVVSNSASPAKTDARLHTVQESLAEIVTGAGITFDTFRLWARETGNLTDSDSLGGFGDIPQDVCKRLIRAKVGLLKGLQAVKEGATV